MKAGDRPRINVVRQIETEIAVARSAPNFSGETDDKLYRKVIGSYVKKMQKAQREYEAAGERGRDHAAKLGFEVDYLSRWLPAALGDEETRALVRASIAELGVDDISMMGRVIGHVMKSGPDLDGAVVSRLVREELG